MDVFGRESKYTSEKYPGYSTCRDYKGKNKKDKKGKEAHFICLEQPKVFVHFLFFGLGPWLNVPIDSHWYVQLRARWGQLCMEPCGIVGGWEKNIILPCLVCVGKQSSPLFLSFLFCWPCLALGFQFFPMTSTCQRASLKVGPCLTMPTSTKQHVQHAEPPTQWPHPPKFFPSYQRDPGTEDLYTTVISVETVGIPLENSFSLSDSRSPPLRTTAIPHVRCRDRIRWRFWGTLQVGPSHFF